MTEQIQIDLWERWRDENGFAGSYTLPDALADLLRSPTLADPPNHVTAVRLVDVVRQIEVEENLIHNAYTVEVKRVLERLGS